MQERIKELLQDVEGTPCWSAIIGSASDFPFVLHLGERLRRSLRLANPRLSFLQRTYEGEYTLLVECAWRVDSPERVVASCWDEPDVRQAALERLVDQKVCAITAEPPGFDLVMKFDDGHVLRCLSVETDAGRSRDNWHLYTPTALLRVGPGAKPELRTAEEAKSDFRRLRLALIGETDDPLALEGRRPRWPRPAPDHRPKEPPAGESGGESEGEPASEEGPKGPKGPFGPLRPVDDPPA